MRKNKSAIKKARQAEERRVRNSHVKTTMKTYTKRALAALSGETDKEQANQSFTEAVSKIYKAASKGVIHKNTASRKVSRLSKKAAAVLSKG